MWEHHIIATNMIQSDSTGDFNIFNRFSIGEMMDFSHDFTDFSPALT
jgi:hypothetical protein